MESKLQDGEGKRQLTQADSYTDDGSACTTNPPPFMFPNPAAEEPPKHGFDSINLFYNKTIDS